MSEVKVTANLLTEYPVNKFDKFNRELILTYKRKNVWCGSETFEVSGNPNVKLPEKVLYN